MMACNIHAQFWAAVRGQKPPADSWPAIIARAGREGMIGYLASIHDEMPDRISHRRQAAAHLLAQTSLYRVVRDALDPLGIPWVVLKGIALGHLLYDDPTARSCGDLDVLVRPSDEAIAGRAIEVAGFSATPHHRELFTGHAGNVDLHTAFLNVDRIKSRGRAMNREIAWHTRIRSTQARLRTDDAADERLRSTEPWKAWPDVTPQSGSRNGAGATDIPVLDWEDLARYLTLHLIHHHGCIGSKWILDLGQLLRLQPDLTDTVREASRSGETVLFLLNKLLLDAENSPSHPSGNASPMDRVIMRAAYEGSDIPGLRFLLTLRDMRNLGDRTLFLRETLIPSIDVMASAGYSSSRKPFVTHLRNISRTMSGLIGVYRRAGRDDI